MFGLILILFPIGVFAGLADTFSIGGLLEDTATLGGYDANTTEETIAVIAGRVTFVALSLLGLIFISLTVYAGYLWMTARGNQDQVSKAKEILTTAVVGIFIVLGAYAFTALIYQAF